MIWIYDDLVHNNTSVLLALQAVGYHNTAFCTASMIIDGCLNIDTDKARLLIIPGGADLYFCEKLNGHGNQEIRDFVQHGGSYLGICAGAYYGCTSLDWGCGDIAGGRELDFHHGTACGPVYNWIENQAHIYDGSWIKAVEIKTNDDQIFMTQYNGGPLFEGVESETIYAHYTDLENHPPAVIGGQFGQGRYILSSPHIEKFGHLLSDGLYKHLNQSYDREQREIDRLLEYEQAQKTFFKNIIDRLL